MILISDFECMGTVFRFSFHGADKELAERLLPAALELLTEADNRFSTYKPDSEVSRFNRSELSEHELSSDARYILNRSRELLVETSGCFDAFGFESGWDPSGIVKGWAAQSVANYFGANGLRDFTINAGGDIVLGPEASGILTKIGIANPTPIAQGGFSAAEVVSLAGSRFRACATSGFAERGEHIWRANLSVVQVSVLGEDLIEADVWATALCVDPTLLSSLPKSLAAKVTLIDRVEKSEGFDHLAVPNIERGSYA